MKIKLFYKVLVLLVTVLWPVATMAKPAAPQDDAATQVYEYVLKINRSALAVVDSNVVVSLQMTAIQDIPATQSVVLVPEIELFPVYLLPPADNSVKVREERGSAYLCFEVNKWNIKPDYMTNPAELMKIHNSVNLVKNDSDVTIRKMTIEGYASPEGTYAHNLMLSEKRTEALKNYLAATNIARGIRIEASGKGENSVVALPTIP